MQQSGFRQVFNLLSWEKMVWMISNHLAVRLHLDSSLSKGSVWDVDASDHFSRAVRNQSFRGNVRLLGLSPLLNMSFFMHSLLKEPFGGVHVICVRPAVASQWCRSIKHQPYQVQMDSKFRPHVLDDIKISHVRLSLTLFCILTRLTDCLDRA